MRKIILNLAVSLDGFIEGPAGEHDWCLTDQDYGMAGFVDETDALFTGRKSFELIRGEIQAYTSKKIYVFSDTLSPGVEAGVEIITQADFDHAVDHIINQSGKSIWLFGGANLISAFINKNLIGELLLSVHPVLLGGGKPLFENLKEQVDLQFISQQVYSTGLVQIRYAVKPKFDMEMLKLL